MSFTIHALSDSKLVLTCNGTALHMRPIISYKHPHPTQSWQLPWFAPEQEDGVSIIASSITRYCLQLYDGTPKLFRPTDIASQQMLLVPLKTNCVHEHAVQIYSYDDTNFCLSLQTEREQVSWRYWRDVTRTDQICDGWIIRFHPRHA